VLLPWSETDFRPGQTPQEIWKTTQGLFFGVDENAVRKGGSWGGVWCSILEAYSTTTEGADAVGPAVKHQKAAIFLIRKNSKRGFPPVNR
jgi:hypothetical protein